MCDANLQNFKIGDQVMLKVSPWKDVIWFEKYRKLKTRYVGPFKILARVSPVAYGLELPPELSSEYNTFHVSNSYLFSSECLNRSSCRWTQLNLITNSYLFRTMDRDVQQLRHSRIPIVKVRWNFQRGPEFTWEREDRIRQEVPPSLHQYHFNDQR